jgi:hypothetical protein
LYVDATKDDGVSAISNFKYVETKVIEIVAHIILYHEYPFMQVEHMLFNKLLKACTPHWWPLSRAIVKALCFGTYELEKKKLKTLLNWVHKVNISVDM